MDRQDAKPSRPSLLAAAETRPAPSSAPGRILADMQNLKPRRRRAAGARLRLVVLAAALAAAGGLWWLGMPGSDPSAGASVAAATPADTPMGVQAIVAPHDDAPAPSAAVIVDEASSAGISPNGSALSSLHADPTGDSHNPFASAPVGVPEVARAAVAAKPSRMVERVPATVNPARTATRIKSPAAPAPAPARATEPDLLATLLGNINRASPAAGAAAPLSPDAPLPALKRARRGSDPDALDALVRQVRERDVAAQVAGVAAVGAAGGSSGKSATADTPSADLQARLRQCPRANTTAGLQCRQRVCAKVAGSDPACPRS